MAASGALADVGSDWNGLDMTVSSMMLERLRGSSSLGGFRRKRVSRHREHDLGDEHFHLTFWWVYFRVVQGTFARQIAWLPLRSPRRNCADCGSQRRAPSAPGEATHAFSRQGREPLMRTQHGHEIGRSK